MSNKILVAVDDGYAQTKVYGTNPAGGDPLRLVFRTSVRSGRYGLKAMGGEGAIDSYRTEEGEEFTVSELIEAENTQFDSFHTSAMNRVLVTHGLDQAGYGGLDVDLITGLPVADYFSRDAIDDAKIDAKRANLKKGVSRISPKTPLPNIVSVDVGCQAVAAWFDYMLDDQLNFRKDPKSRVAIVDIGGRTTDIAVVVGGKSIDFAQSGTANIGVLDVYKALEDGIRKAHGLKDRFPLADLDYAVRNKQIELWGEMSDISDLVSDAIAEIDGKIEREVERRLGSAATLSAVVFVGGGGALFKSIPERMRNGVLMDDPEFANARGLWKFTSLRERRSAQAA